MSSNPIALRRDGAVVDVAKLPAYVKTAFVAPLEAIFRKVNDAPDAAALAVRIYGEQLAKFDESVVSRAAQWFIKNRKDPFYPTVSECIEICQKISNLDQAEKDRVEFNAMLAKERAEKEIRRAKKQAQDKAEDDAMRAEWQRLKEEDEARPPATEWSLPC